MVARVRQAGTAGPGFRPAGRAGHRPPAPTRLGGQPARAPRPHARPGGAPHSGSAKSSRRPHGCAGGMALKHPVVVGGMHLVRTAGGFRVMYLERVEAEKESSTTPTICAPLPGPSKLAGGCAPSCCCAGSCGCAAAGGCGSCGCGSCGCCGPCCSRCTLASGTTASPSSLLASVLPPLSGLLPSRGYIAMPSPISISRSDPLCCQLDSAAPLPAPPPSPPAASPPASAASVAASSAGSSSATSTTALGGSSQCSSR